MIYSVMRERTMKAKQNGFTLMEIMMVLVIMGILVAMVGPKIAGKADVAKKEVAKQEMAMVANAAYTYYISKNKTTNNLSDLQEFGIDPSMKDPWGRTNTYIITADSNTGKVTVSCTPPNSNQPIIFEYP